MPIKKEQLPFKIEHIDSLGQGVSKIGDKISFILKTLPGEEGIGELRSEKKGVRFLTLNSLNKVSKDRISEECPHFKDCPSCHFLHTDYENELKIKENNLKWILKTEQEIFIHPAPRRFNYRNRIQLHYDKVTQKLGHIDALKDEIVEVPGCLIGEGPVLDALRDLYQDKHWFDLVKKAPEKGHIEIYHHQGKTSINVNKAYSSGGFTQVFSEMNNQLKRHLNELVNSKKDLLVLDLFGGNGNLSKDFRGSEVLVVDISPPPKKLAEHQKYVQINLKKKNYVKFLGGKHFNIIIMDPPRSGFKDMDNFIKNVSCDEFFYVSCNPATLKRDLGKLSSFYKVSEIHLFDFFPSTYHFETLVRLSKV